MADEKKQGEKGTIFWSYPTEEVSKKKSTIENITDHIPDWIPGVPQLKATVKQLQDTTPKDALEWITEKSEPGSAARILEESRKRTEGTAKKESPLGEYK